MDRKWNVLRVAVGIAIWLGFGAGLALADHDLFVVHCVNVTPADLRFGDCDDQHPLGIQDAVNHAESGETVLVGAGTYPEQVKIIRPLLLEGAGMALTTIEPLSVSANTTSITTGAPIAAIVLVEGATGVAVTDLAVDGSAAGSTFICDKFYMGIFYRAASGLIDSTHVTSINPPGCANNALGIFVQTDKTGKGKADVAILGNMVDDYGKNGITANQAGTFVTVNGNVVTGNNMFTSAGCVPPEVNVAQNGVQIGFAARGRVTGNTISNHCYSPPTFVACGVLFFKAGGGVGRAQNNTFAGNEGNICNVSGAIGSAHSPFNQ